MVKRRRRSLKEGNRTIGEPCGSVCNEDGCRYKLVERKIAGRELKEKERAKDGQRA